MPIWSKLSGGLRSLFHGREEEQEMDEELRAFLQDSAEWKMQVGMNATEAQRAARVEMGSVESVKDKIRAVGWESAVEALWTDVRYSVRVLAKAPLFTSMVILTLALGIGANTAIFSLMNALLLKALPVEKPEELLEISGSGPIGPSEYGLTNPLWEQIRDRQDVFSGAFAWGSEQFDLAKGGMTQNADGLWVSGDFFRTLGLYPAAGRLLSAPDDRRGCAALAVLSDSFWRSHYSAAGSAIGSTISLNGHPFEVIGVAPAGFYGMTVGRKFDIAVPICAAEVFDGPKSRLDNGHTWWLHVAGRIKTGIGMARLKSRLAMLSPAVYGAAVPGGSSEWQDSFRKRVMMPLPLTTGVSDLREEYEEPLRILMAVVGLVLLIACANIASLMMARAAARAKEMAMRLALGASRLRLMRQLIAECLLLSFAGAALGLLLARWGGTLLLNYLSGVHRQVFLDFALDARVLIFTAGAAIITGLLFGVAPAVRGTIVSLASTVKENHATAGGPRTRLRLWIVASQVALSLVLLVTAGLLLRSFRNLATTNVGFEPEHVLLVNVNLFTAKTPMSEYTATYDRIEAQLRALPGVVSAARSMMTPLGNSEWDTDIHSDVPHPTAGENANQVYFNFVDRYYFATLRTPLLAGRDFNSSDSAKSLPVAVINQTVARKFFPGVDPVGHTFRPEAAARKLGPPVLVVGVATDAKYESMREESVPTVFLPLLQSGLEDPDDSFEIRSALPQRAMEKAIENAVAEVNGEIPIEIHPLMAQVDGSMARECMLAALSAFFGGLALLLATIGVYGTLSYLVAQRRIEFGIRMALGATSRSILTLVMRNVATLLIGGIITGIGLSLATSRLLGALLFNIEARDPVTIAISGVLIAAASLAAGLLAARRATSVDPMVALRQE